MKTVWGVAMMGLLAVLLPAALVDANPDKCSWYPGVIASECFDKKGVFFSNMFEGNTTGYLCKEAGEVQSCIERFNTDCPDLAIAQNESDVALNDMFQTVSVLCDEDEATCPGGMHEEFRDELETCRRSVPWNAEREVVCPKLDVAITCMELLLPKYELCGWMSNDFKRGFEFWIDYYRALRVVKYSCQA